VEASVPFSFVPLRLDRLLVATVEELAREFPDLPVGVVVRCIAASRAAASIAASDDLGDVALAIADAARADLRYLSASVPDTASAAVPAG
jgi:hypothetical protein